MNLGPPEVLIILAILAVFVVPVIVAIVFLSRRKGLDDSTQTESYPPGWEPPPAIPPAPGPGPNVWSDETQPPPPPAS